MIVCEYQLHLYHLNLDENQILKFNYAFTCGCDNYDLIHNATIGHKVVICESCHYNLRTRLQGILCNLGGACCCNYLGPFQICCFCIKLRCMLNFSTMKICDEEIKFDAFGFIVKNLKNYLKDYILADPFLCSI